MQAKLSRRILILAALWIGIASPHIALAQSLDAIEQELTQGGRPDDIIKQLEALPLEVRKTTDYHWLLARAYQADKQPWGAAEALAVLRQLDPGNKRPVGPMTKWLQTSANALFNDALQRRARGDQVGAAEAYIKAVRCDLSTLARSDNGLGERALATMTKALNSGQKPPIYWYGLGFINYRFTQLRASRAAFVEYKKHEADPYWIWKTDQIIARIDSEIAYNTRTEQAETKRRTEAREREYAEARAREQAEARVQAAKDSQRDAADRRQALLDIDAKIRSVDDAIAAQRQASQATVGTPVGGGDVAVYGVNQREAKRRMEELEAKKAELEEQRGGMNQGSTESEEFKRQRDLVDLDGKLESVNRRIAETEARQKGQVGVSQFGTPIIVTANQRVIKAQLQALQEEKEALEAQRYSR